MLVAVQTMVILCAVCGVLMFLYVHLFSYRRLRRQERSLNRQDAREDREIAAQGTQVALGSFTLGSSTQEALFYMYHEQVRRFIDAKIDIMRSAAETQNRILLMQAEVVRDAAKEPEPLMLEVHSDGDCEVALPVPAAPAAPASARMGTAAILAQQLQAARQETERHLSEIDQQIRTLPGPSMDGWVHAQANATAE